MGTSMFWFYSGLRSWASYQHAAAPWEAGPGTHRFDDQAADPPVQKVRSSREERRILPALHSVCDASQSNRCRIRQRSGRDDLRDKESTALFQMDLVVAH